MRAKEFISEMHDWHTRGIPGMKAMDGVDQYYDLYRFGLALAASGDPAYPMQGDTRGDVENSPATLSYTDVEEEIINAALAKMGKTARQITPRISQEPEDTNTQSPMKPQGRIKRSENT